MTNGTGQSLPEVATRGVEAIGIMVAERDAFRTRNEKLEVDCAMMTQEIESLKQRLVLASAERDHYMRHSVELTSRLNNIQIVINETVREARPSSLVRTPSRPATWRN
jgi:hypothetical protein